MEEQNDTAEAFAAVLSLGRALLTVIAVQALGYIMKGSGRLPPAAEQGIGLFAGGIALPSLIFTAIAKLNFTVVPLALIAAVLVSKLIVVFLCVLLGYQQTRAGLASPGSAAISGGILSMLGTNSDDIALGLPVFVVLFPPNIVAMTFVLSTLQARRSAVSTRAPCEGTQR